MPGSDDSDKIWKLFLEANQGKPDDESDDEPEMEKGETNFPHGSEFPNVKKDYEEVIRVDRIRGVDDERVKEFEQSNIKTVIEYVNKYLPWVRTSNEEVNRDLDTIYKNPEDHSLPTLISTIERPIGHQIYWMHQAKEKITGQGSSDWWITAYDKAQDILKHNPDLMNQVDKFRELVEYIDGDSPENASNPSNYPLYVTLYDITRKYGGEHEGGWWYDYSTPVKSVKVAKPADVEKTAKALYNLIPSADLGGQPFIYLEVKTGSLTNEEKPQYS